MSTKVHDNSDKAMPLSEKILEILHAHDQRHLGYFALTSDQAKRTRQYTGAKIIKEIIPGSRQRNQVLIIGKPGNYFVYIDKPFADSVLHYCQQVGIHHHDFLVDISISCMLIKSGYFRSKEIYHISDSGGSVQELDKNGCAVFSNDREL